MEHRRHKGPGGRGPMGPGSDRDKSDRPKGERVTGDRVTGHRTTSEHKASTRGKPPGEAGFRPRPAARESLSKADGGLWLYGLHPVLAALENATRRCRRLIGLAPEVEALDPRLRKALISRDIAYEPVAREVFDRILPAGSVHQGLGLAVEPLEELDIHDTCTRAEGERAIVLVLDQVTDPHNVGAVLRSAAAFGAKAVIMTDRHAPGATGVLAKAASGALDVTPLVRVTNLARALDDLAELGYWRIALDGNAEHNLAAVDTTGSVALVLGAEGDGLRRLTRERCDLIARLPITGAVESLNVSNAAAIALYELIR